MAPRILVTMAGFGREDAFSYGGSRHSCDEIIRFSRKDCGPGARSRAAA